MKKTSFSPIDCVLLVLSLVLCFGTAFVFKTCGPMEDGSWMRCHWAGMSVVGLGAAMSAMALVRIFFGRPLRAGTDVAFISTAVLAALLPGVIIPLCGNKSMHCHTITRPSVFVVSVLIAAVAVIDIIVQAKKKA